MRVTFVTPPVLQGRRPAERTAGCTHVVYQAPNTYELTVAAVLEEAGHEVRCRDFVYDGLCAADFERWLAADDSEVYLIWAVNLSIGNDLEAVKIILRLRPQARTVLMGPGPTHFTELCLIDDRISVVRGEPELTVAALLAAFQAGAGAQDVAGVSWLCDGKPTHNAARPLVTDLDALPLPARHFIAGRSYHNPKLKSDHYTTAFTSRNCPYRCIYCVPSSLTFAREIEYRRQHGRKPPVAKRSVESVDREMAQIRAMGYDAVGFMDDNFIWDEERTLALCEVMSRHDPPHRASTGPERMPLCGLGRGVVQRRNFGLHQKRGHQPPNL